ncbi:NBS-LRR-like protein [Panicum miliaceum]|uniref:NBS-LRR-like protein n=1 Tax=Panicum miliaceum TaxID=4540 RepID=A0A3L6R2K1_PANMI|nr:NBS-LRR-like protein [Panicum miliaceum]
MAAMDQAPSPSSALEESGRAPSSSMPATTRGCIVFFTRNDIAGDGGGGVVRHRNCHLGGERRMLIVVELDCDRLTESLDEDVVEVLWRRLAYKDSSGGEEGTREAGGKQFEPRFMKLCYWYFFKVLAFGAMDAAEHPKLVSMAMDMAAVMNGCFLSANMFAGLLRSSADARRALGCSSGGLARVQAEEPPHVQRARPGGEVHPWEVNSAVRVPSLSEEYIVILDDYQQTGEELAPS